MLAGLNYVLAYWKEEPHPAWVSVFPIFSQEFIELGDNGKYVSLRSFSNVTDMLTMLWILN